MAMSEESTSEPVSRRSWVSLLAVLFVQTQNSFNDNFVKMILIGLGLAVAQGVVVFSVDVGEKIQYIMAILIPIPFILGAPIAGWISDRFSKKNVIVASLVLQLAIFILIYLSIVQRNVVVAIFGYFLLAVQSTVFSPAKQGILKEIVGSQKLGFANGLSQMLAMVGILLGAWLGGKWFDQLLAGNNRDLGVSLDNAWLAAGLPTLIIGAGCLLPLALTTLIQKTPSYSVKKLTSSIFVEHFVHLKMMFNKPGLRIVALRIALYWFVANMFGVVMISFGKELFPDAEKGGAAGATSMMMGCIGIGLILGSVVVSVLSRKRNQLKLIPLGAIGMTLGFLGIALFDPTELPFKVSIAVVGFFAGFFLIPLSALLQDLAEEDERGRIISASNLLNSATGVIAILLCNGLDTAGFPAANQIIVALVVIGIVALWTLSYWSKSGSTGPISSV